MSLSHETSTQINNFVNELLISQMNHQDADRVKRSTRHDFETQRAMNQCSSQSHKET